MTDKEQTETKEAKKMNRNKEDLIYVDKNGRNILHKAAIEQ